LKGPQRPS